MFFRKPLSLIALVLSLQATAFASPSVTVKHLELSEKLRLRLSQVESLSESSTYRLLKLFLKLESFGIRIQELQPAERELFLKTNEALIVHNLVAKGEVVNSRKRFDDLSNDEARKLQQLLVPGQAGAFFQRLPRSAISSVIGELKIENDRIVRYLERKKIKNARKVLGQAPSIATRFDETYLDQLFEVYAAEFGIGPGILSDNPLLLARTLKSLKGLRTALQKKGIDPRFLTLGERLNILSQKDGALESLKNPRPAVAVSKPAEEVRTTPSLESILVNDYAYKPEQARQFTELSHGRLSKITFELKKIGLNLPALSVVDKMRIVTKVSFKAVVNNLKQEGKISKVVQSFDELSLEEKQSIEKLVISGDILFFLKTPKDFKSYCAKVIAI